MTDWSLSGNGVSPIDGLDLEPVALYAPTEATDDGRRAMVTVVTRGAAGCTAFADGEIDGRSAIPTWNEVERSVRGRVVA